MHEILIRFNGTEFNENNLSIYIPMYETKYYKVIHLKKMCMKFFGNHFFNELIMKLKMSGEDNLLKIITIFFCSESDTRAIFCEHT